MPLQVNSNSLQQGRPAPSPPLSLTRAVCVTHCKKDIYGCRIQAQGRLRQQSYDIPSEEEIDSPRAAILLQRGIRTACTAPKLLDASSYRPHGSQFGQSSQLETVIRPRTDSLCPDTMAEMTAGLSQLCKAARDMSDTAHARV